MVCDSTWNICVNLGEPKAFCCTTFVACEVWYEQSIACKSCLPFASRVIRCQLPTEDEVNYLGASNGWINEHSLQCKFLGLSICGIVPFNFWFSLENWYLLTGETGRLRFAIKKQWENAPWEADNLRPSAWLQNHTFSQVWLLEYLFHKYMWFEAPLMLESGLLPLWKSLSIIFSGF